MRGADIRPDEIPCWAAMKEKWRTIFAGRSQSITYDAARARPIWSVLSYLRDDQRTDRSLSTQNILSRRVAALRKDDHVALFLAEYEDRPLLAPLSLLAIGVLHVWRPPRTSTVAHAHHLCSGRHAVGRSRKVPGTKFPGHSRCFWKRTRIWASSAQTCFVAIPCASWRRTISPISPCL